MERDNRYRPSETTVAAMDKATTRYPALTDAVGVLNKIYNNAGVHPQDIRAINIELLGHATGALSDRSAEQLAETVETARIISGAKSEPPPSRQTVLFQRRIQRRRFSTRWRV